MAVPPGGEASPACAVAGEGAAVATFSLAAGGACRWASTSPLVIRPPLPVGAMRAGSISFSATRRRTDGASGTAVSAAAPSLDAAPAAAGRDADGADAGAELAACARAGAATSAGVAAGSSVPIVAPMATVWPSATAIFRTPVEPAGTTLLALSVSSSKSGSPALTREPSDLSQRAKIPSVIDSPTPGTVIGTAAMASGLLAGGPRRQATAPGSP